MKFQHQWNTHSVFQALLISLLSFYYGSAFADSTSLHNIRLHSVQIIYNLDSLEKKINHMNPNSDSYLKALISLEKSRNALSSYLMGKYINEIDSQSRKHNFLYGVGLAAYFRSSLLNNQRFSGYDESQLNANIAYTIFSIYNDKEDILRAGLLKIRSILLFFDIIKNNSAFSDTSVTNQIFRKCKMLLHKYDSNFVYHQGDLSYYDYCFTKMKIWFADNNDTSSPYKIKTLALDCMHKITADTQFSYLLPTFQTFYAISLAKQDSFFKSNIYYLKSLSTIPTNESSYHVLTNYNIADNLFFMKQYTLAKVYCKKAIEYNKSFNNFNKLNLLKSYQTLFTIYSLEHNYKLGLKYATLYINSLIEFNKNDIKKAYLYTETIAKIKRKQLEIEILTANNIAYRNQQKLVLISLYLSILLLTLFTIFIYMQRRSNKRLSVANSKISELQAAREKLLAIIGHDLRSPINGYQDMANTISQLLKLKRYDQIEKISTHIDSTGIKLNLMIENLLQWAKNEQKMLVYSPSIINLMSFWEELLTIYIPIATQKNIEIIFTALDIHIYTDSRYLATVIRNVIDNAIKNSTYGSKVLIEQLTTSEELIIEVKNSTILDQKQIDLIAIFFTSDKIMQPQEMGFGLGLILIKEFVHKMKGHIQIEYEKDLFTISISLPIDL